MIKTKYELLESTPTTIKKKATYESDDLADKTYEGIINKYSAYSFDEHIQRIKDEFNCQSYSYIMFYFCYQINDFYQKIKIIGATLSIFNREEVEYLPNIILYDENLREELIEDTFNRYYDRVYIKAEMETKFYIDRSLDLLSEYEAEQLEDLHDEEDEDEGYEENQAIIPLIETPFVSDNCSICLTAKPDIIIVPCLHQCVCSQCEEAGKLIKCPTCRERIEKKIKI